MADLARAHARVVNAVLPVRHREHQTRGARYAAGHSHTRGIIDSQNSRQSTRSRLLNSQGDGRPAPQVAQPEVIPIPVPKADMACDAGGLMTIGWTEH